MPSATNTMWLKRFGRLPWWRARAYAAKTPGNGRARAYEFDESEHPRDEDGKWTEGGGSVRRMPIQQKGIRGRLAIRERLKSLTNEDIQQASSDELKQWHSVARAQAWTLTHGGRNPNKLGLHFDASAERIENELARREGKRFSKGVHSFASTQLDLPNDLQARLRAWVQANVAREDLAPDEAQDDAFHVTVLYGLKTDQHEVIRQFVEGTGLVRIELGVVAQFDKDPRYDVLIVPVVKEAGLRTLRKRLTDQLPWEATQDGYAPHVTLAYVRKGAGRRHLGATAFLGEAVTVDRLRVSDSQGVTSWVSLLPVMTLKKPNGNSRTYAAPVDPLKEGETLTFNPETGERGVWRNIGGRSVFIAVRKGESVPKAIKRVQKEGEEKGQQERGTMAIRAAAELSPTYEPPAGSPLANPEIRKQAIAQAEESLTYSSIVGLGLAMRKRAQELFTGEPMRSGVGMQDAAAFVRLMEQRFLPAGVKVDDLIRTMYADTQRQLTEQGTTSMKLYRGTNNPAVMAAKRKRPEPTVDVLVDMRGFSSWSQSERAASKFGSSVIEADVPASMIWSIPKTFFDVPAGLGFLMTSGPRRFEEEVILVPTQRLQGRVGKSLQSTRRGFSSFFSLDKAVGVTLDDVAEAPRPDRKLEVWLLIHALRRVNPTLDRAAIKAQVGELLGRTGGVNAEKTFALVMTPHGYPLPLSRELTRIERKVDFATIVLEGDRLQAQAVARVQAVLANAKDKLLALVERKHMAGELTARFVLDLELRGLGQLVPTLREALGAFFRFGQRTADGELRRGRAGVRLFAKPVEALKEGETLTFNPETGERGVWRNIGGRSVFISIKKGESVPDAVKRAQNVKQRTPPVGKRGGLPSQSPDPSSVLGSDPASSASSVVVGSSDQAEQFASGSARPGRWFHGAEARFSDPAEALRMSVPGQTRGAVFGSGVYLTDSADEATEYGDRVFEARVQVKNPLIYPTEASSFQRLMDQTEPPRRASVAKRVRAFRDAVRRAAEHSGKSNEEVITAIARRSGYDAIEVWHPDRTWLVVPDPHRIMVIAGRSKKTALAGNGKTYQVKLVPEGLPPEAALEFFERKASLWATDVRGPLLQSTKAVLFDAIKRGAPLRETIAMLEQVFLPWVGDEDALRGDGDVTAPFRLETLVRTNTNESFNEGRKAQFQEEVDSGFVIGFQFSAIIDSRTTPVCAFLDEKIFRTDSPELDRLTPPRHFGCRSILSPVLRTEGPVEYITQRQVARGIDLSGAGFVERRPSREVVVDKEMAYAEA